MGQRDRTEAQFQRNAFVPSLLAAAVLVLAPIAFARGWTAIMLYAVAIIGLIVAWFALQARQWWWTVVFVAVAVVWNPILPFPFDGDIWMVAQFVAAVVFLVAGVLIRSPRE